MTAFAWQTMLLLSLAYLLGCWVACLARRMLAPDVADAARTSVPAAAVAGAVAAASAARQAVPAAVAAAQPGPVSQPPSPSPVREAFRRADTLEPQPPASEPQPARALAQAAPAQVPAPQAGPDDTVARFERALKGPLTQVAAPSKVVQGPVAEVAPAAPVSTVAAAASATVAPSALQGAATPARSAPTTPAAAPAGSPMAAPPRPAPAQPSKPDDLKRIRTIDSGVEAALHRLGIRTFSEIGAWKPADVARISQELAFKGRIEQENWIEQAQILASGKETYYSSRLARGEVAKARPVANEGQQPATTPPKASVPPPGPAAKTRSAPAASPVPAASTSPTPAQPARQTAPPHPRPDRSSVEAAAAAAAALAAAAAAAKASSDRASPGRTEPASAPGPAAPSAPADRRPAVSEKAAFASPAPPPAVPAAPSVPAAAAATAAVPAAKSAPRPAVSSRDALQRIGGITPEIEKLLNVQGVARFAQIAHWTGQDVERFDRLLGHPGRIRRENWIEQAQILGRGGETAHSREFDRRASAAASAEAAGSPKVQPPPRPSPPPAPQPSPAVVATPPHAPVEASSPVAPAPASSPPATPVAASAMPTSLAADTRPLEPPSAPPASPRPPRLADAIRDNEGRTAQAQPARTSDISTLRSVRSEALRGAPAGGIGGTARAGETHDLKRIRGIGVLIEKKLNSMGITRYGQIAEWTVTDIERVSQALDFKGRIERENWVEQARILASGGQTEFSRRADRGETG